MVSVLLLLSQEHLYFCVIAINTGSPLLLKQIYFCFPFLSALPTHLAHKWELISPKPLWCISLVSLILFLVLGMLQRSWRTSPTSAFSLWKIRFHMAYIHMVPLSSFKPHLPPILCWSWCKYHVFIYLARCTTESALLEKHWCWRINSGIGSRGLGLRSCWSSKKKGGKREDSGIRLNFILLLSNSFYLGEYFLHWDKNTALYIYSSISKMT